VAFDFYELVSFANLITYFRKSQAGKSLELHLEAIFTEEGLPFAHGETSGSDTFISSMMDSSHFFSPTDAMSSQPDKSSRPGHQSYKRGIVGPVRELHRSLNTFTCAAALRPRACSS
jgi:hypothetical protein